MFGTKTAANSGIAMMLKSMGIDVDGIQQAIEGQLKKIESLAESIDTRLARIEAGVQRIEMKLPGEHPPQELSIYQEALKDGDPSGSSERN